MHCEQVIDYIGGFRGHKGVDVIERLAMVYIALPGGSISGGFRDGSLYQWHRFDASMVAAGIVSTTLSGTVHSRALGSLHT